MQPKRSSPSFLAGAVLQAPLAHSGPLPPRAVHVQCGAVRGLCGGCLQSGKADVSDLRRRSLAPARLSDCVMLAYSWQQWKWKVPYDEILTEYRRRHHTFLHQRRSACAAAFAAASNDFFVYQIVLSPAVLWFDKPTICFHLFYLYTCRCSDKPHTAHPHGSDIHFINPSTDQIPP